MTDLSASAELRRPWLPGELGRLTAVAQMSFLLNGLAAVDRSTNRYTSLQNFDGDMNEFAV